MADSYLLGNEGVPLLLYSYFNPIHTRTFANTHSHTLDLPSFIVPVIINYVHH